MTSDDEQRPPSRRPRQPRREATPPPSSSPSRADQGDLWTDSPNEPPVPTPSPETNDGLDDFIADLAPPEEERPPTARPAAARRAPAPPPVYEEYDDYDEPEYSMLRNPYVLAALAVAAAIILAVAFVIIFSEGGDSPTSVAGGVGSRTPTPQPGELPGVQAKVIAIAAIREGPGLEFFEIGLLKNGQDVSVVGRNDDSSWYQIIFAGTELTGWVPDSALRVPDGSDDLIEVVVFTPIPKPSVEQPTPTPPVTPTEEALGPPDISVEVLGNVCPASGPINLAIRNVGDVSLTERRIILSVSTPEGVINEQTLSLTLGAGQIVPVNTGIEVQPPRTIIAIIFASEPQDLDPSNNVVTCVVAGEGGPGPNSTSVPPTPED